MTGFPPLDLFLGTASICFSLKSARELTPEITSEFCVAYLADWLVYIIVVVFCFFFSSSPVDVFLYRFPLLCVFCLFVHLCCFCWLVALFGFGFGLFLYVCV